LSKKGVALLVEARHLDIARLVEHLEVEELALALGVLVRAHRLAHHAPLDLPSVGVRRQRRDGQDVAAAVALHRAAPSVRRLVLLRAAVLLLRLAVGGARAAVLGGGALLLLRAAVLLLRLAVALLAVALRRLAVGLRLAVLLLRRLTVGLLLRLLAGALLPLRGGLVPALLLVSAVLLVLRGLLLVLRGLLVAPLLRVLLLLRRRLPLLLLRRRRVAAGRCAGVAPLLWRPRVSLRRRSLLAAGLVELLREADLRLVV